MGLQEKIRAWVQLIFDVINTAVSEEQQPSKTTYIKWKDTDRYSVGKYSSEYGPVTAVRRFKSKFPKLNESTARYFKKRYEDSLNERNENETTPSKALTKYKTKTGTPLLLGVLDAMFRNTYGQQAIGVLLFQEQVPYQPPKRYYRNIRI